MQNQLIKVVADDRHAPSEWKAYLFTYYDGGGFKANIISATSDGTVTLLTCDDKSVSHIEWAAV